MDHGAVEIAGNRKLDEIQRLVSPDEDDAAQQGRGGVVGMVAATGQVLALHRTYHHVFVGKRTVEQLVHSIRRSRTGCSARADTRARIYLLAYRHIDVPREARHLEELANDRRNDILLDVFGQRHRGFIRDGNTLAFRRSHLQYVAHLVQGDAHNIEAAAQVRNRSWCENSYFLHIYKQIRYPIIFFLSVMAQSVAFHIA